MRKTIIFILGCFITLQSFANLTINIQQGVDKPYPIAVVPFSDRVVPVINNDLGNSGRFSLLNPDQMPEHPTSNQVIHWGKWRSQAPMTEYLLTGAVHPVPGGFDVKYALNSLYNRHILYGQSFQHVKPDRMRALSHFIADKVYQVITGKRGYFSTRLAYVSVTRTQLGSCYQLLIADSDGFSPRILVKQYNNPIASPVWSPNGQQLAYVSYANNRMAVYTINISTGQRHLISNFQGINSAPSFSPDGKELAMALSKGNSSRTNLFLYNLATGQRRQLTHYGTNTSPSFSPDGRSIIFTSNRKGNPQIFKMNLNSRHVSLLTGQGVQNFSAKYLPNGKGIVFMHQANRGGAIHIAVMKLSSKKIRVITHGRLDKSPSPAPNGQMIIYANYDQNHGVLAEASINGRIQIQLPSSKGSVQSPAWSPFLI